MRVIGESKPIDLSKKLTLEVSLHELAVMKVGLSAISTQGYNKEVPQAVKDELVSDMTAGDGLSGTDYPYIVFQDLNAILKAEGVVEE